MSETSIEFSVPCDSDGYVTLECPFCQEEFKLLANEVQNEEQPFNELFCPYCGLTDSSSNFNSTKVMEHAQALFQNHVMEQLDSAFKGMVKGINKTKGKGLSMKATYTPSKKVEVPEIREHDTAEEIFQCKACERHEKVIYAAGASKVFCAYCGVDLWTS